jgi:RimJ/RimL family protein N-acetyltransferase
LIIVEGELIVFMDKNLNFRMLAYSDYEAFKEACLVSREELSTFLDLGQYMEYFNFSDYWALFVHLLKEPETNAYGLFDGKTLLGSALVGPASRSFGAQVVGWIRHGHHGRGLATIYLEKIIERCFANGHHFVELVIDQDNSPSNRVAQKLGLTRISEWENFESGQGLANSGKFTLYYAFRNDIENLAQKLSLEPYQLIQQLWILEHLNLVRTPEFALRRQVHGHNRLSQTMRFLDMEKNLPKEEAALLQETTLR